MSFLSAIIGHSIACEVLSRFLEHDRLAHALLLVGQKHLGKTLVAETLIQHLFQTDREIALLPDVVVIDRMKDQKTGKRKSLISIEQVRSVRERLSMTALLGGWKVVLIKNAHKLSTGAANALLKTLEEPSGKTLIILTALDDKAVAETIASRCQILRFHAVVKSVIVEALMQRGIDATLAAEAAEVSLGKPGIAIRYANDADWRQQKMDAMDATAKIFLQSLPEQFAEVMTLVPKTDQQKEQKYERFLADAERILRDVLLKQLGCSVSLSHPLTQQIALKWNPKRTVQTLQQIQSVREAARHHVNLHLSLESIFLTAH